MSELEEKYNSSPESSAGFVPADNPGSVEPILDQKSIGEKLREARLERGLELEKVSEATKIKKKFLELLEASDFMALPGLVTARGFMKVYAQFLGLNLAELSEQFNRLFPDQAVGVNTPKNKLNKPIQVGLEVDKKDFFPSGLKTMNAQGFKYTKSSKSRQNQKMLISIGGAVALVVLVLMISSLYFKSSMDSIKTMPRQQADVQALTAKLTPEAMQNMQKDFTKVYVNAQALNKTYVTVIIDGRMVFKGMLDKGDVKSWEGDQYIKIKASVPRNLDVFVNGTDEGVFADQLSMLEKTYFPPQNTPAGVTPAATQQNLAEPNTAVKSTETGLEPSKTAESAVKTEETQNKPAENTDLGSLTNPPGETSAPATQKKTEKPGSTDQVIYGF